MSNPKRQEHNIQWEDAKIETGQSCSPEIQTDMIMSQNLGHSDIDRVSKSQCLPDVKQGEEWIQQQRQNRKAQLERNLNINKVGKEFDMEKVDSQSFEDEDSVNSAKSRASSLNEKAEKIKIQRDDPRQNYDSPLLETLNVLVAGSEDTGKTTFIQCFKEVQFKKNSGNSWIQKRSKASFEFIEAKKDLSFQGKNESSRVNFIDFPGFGFESDLYFQYIRKILKYGRQNQNSRRVHCILYFFSGPRMKRTDLAVASALSNSFNLIPVIAKSDQYTSNQIREMKQAIQLEKRLNFFDVESTILQRYGTDSKILCSEEFGNSPPFAVACSTTKIRKENLERSVFARQHRHGVLEVQNSQHTEFLLLLEVLTQHIKKDLILRRIEIETNSEGDKSWISRGSLQNVHSQNSQEQIWRDQENQNGFGTKSKHSSSWSGKMLIAAGVAASLTLYYFVGYKADTPISVTKN